MKITRLELFHISIPFAKPYKLSKVYGTLHNAHAVIFKVHTDEGIVGLGEADPLNPFTEETPASVMVVAKETLAPHLLGQDPMQVGILELTLDHAVLGNLIARGAVNMALYDIMGKAKNLPVHTLLGGLKHPKLPILDALGSGTPEEDLAIIEEKMAQGFRSFMLKMGVLPISVEIERMISVRKRYGDQVTILVDVNQGWEIAQTREFIDGIKGYLPDLIEQPVRRWDIEGLKRIRELSPCPLSADESLSTIRDAATLIRERAVDAFTIKVSKNGGLDKSRQIALVADAFGLKCLMNSMLEFGITQAASLQLGCTLPNLLNVGHAYHSVLRMSDDVTDFGRNISGAVVSVPSENGLGITLDEGKLKKYTKDYIEVKEAR
jgi:L-alanine-DL-glutamate epimerase-like enolase superfamily enzyme